MSFASRLYVGHVVHRRLRPRVHALRYSCFWLLLDLDELPRLSRALRLFAYNGRALFGFLDRDHGTGAAEPLRPHVETMLEQAGIDIGGGSIRILCMPRVLGYDFNPLSVYFCHGPDGTIQAVIYEVSNTFGERHSYVMAVRPDGSGVIRQCAPKSFYVSPFMDADLSYDFRVRPPGDTVNVTIRVSGPEGAVLVAVLEAEQRPLTDRSLLLLAIVQPLLTLKVVAAIHWEALKLWLKGIGLRPKPAPPERPLTLGNSAVGEQKAAPAQASTRIG